jgi:HK97 family phage prohead protease
MSKQQPKRIVFTSTPRLTLSRTTRTKPGTTFVNNSAGEAMAANVEKPESVATLSGYAMVWGAVSSDRGGYKVRLLPNSATFTTPTFALYHHEFANVIGNTANNTLRIIPDDTGVRVEIDLPDTCTGRDVEELVEGGYVGGMSFSMVTAPEGNETVEAGETILNVTGFVCDEVTVTPIPAFVATSIEVAEDNEPEMSKAEDDDDEEDYDESDEMKLARYQHAAYTF